MAIMQITRKAEYALRIMISLSTASSPSCSARAIAQQQRVPKYFLDKIIHALLEKGLVYSRRGSRGGYGLARSAQEISFKDIIEAVEGPIHLNICVGNTCVCELQPTCTMFYVWEEGQRKVLELFSRTSLADLHRHPKVRIPFSSGFPNPLSRPSISSSEGLHKRGEE